jgi:hypothetical protein
METNGGTTGNRLITIKVYYLIEKFPGLWVYCGEFSEGLVPYKADLMAVLEHKTIEPTLNPWTTQQIKYLREGSYI